MPAGALASEVIDAPLDETVPADDVRRVGCNVASDSEVRCTSSESVTLRCDVCGLTRFAFTAQTRVGARHCEQQHQPSSSRSVKHMPVTPARLGCLAGCREFSAFGFVPIRGAASTDEARRDAARRAGVGFAGVASFRGCAATAAQQIASSAPVCREVAPRSNRGWRAEIARKRGEDSSERQGQRQRARASQWWTPLPSRVRGARLSCCSFGMVAAF